MTKTLPAVLAALCLAACGGGAGRPDDAATPPGTDPSPDVAGVLDLHATARGVEGTYTAGDDRISFQSAAVDGDIDLQVTLNGLVLDALLRPADGVSSLDGFAEANGASTQLVDQDRALLSGFYRALNRVSKEELGNPGVSLRRAVGLWAEHPTTVDLKRVVMGDQGRGYTMLCSYAKCGGAWTGSCSSYTWYSYAKHDCNWGGFGVVNNQQIAQLGDHFSCSGDEWYWNNGWVCGEPDHWARPYVVGNCFGRCGGGCGGDTQYTVDATNHDGCVRNGHALASLYCDDQFTAASDDELFAPDCY
ncbi:MAG TPA: hypothetical protein VFA20_12330 [Myxococcaceae bacterium]|nr:hypothetical protein [Myxococcaceae bacterium]